MFCCILNFCYILCFCHIYIYIYIYGRCHVIWHIYILLLITQYHYAWKIKHGRRVRAEFELVDNIALVAQTSSAEANEIAEESTKMKRECIRAAHIFIRTHFHLTSSPTLFSIVQIH
uniref:Uncharacterized protein n=1 Tax=Parascaris univalens TaxID=6257 RepID=A0A915BCZ4_PARUN